LVISSTGSALTGSATASTGSVQVGELLMGEAVAGFEPATAFFYFSLRFIHWKTCFYPLRYPSFESCNVCKTFSIEFKRRTGAFRFTTSGAVQNDLLIVRDIVIVIRWHYGSGDVPDVV